MAHVQLATQVVFTITKFKNLNYVYNVVSIEYSQWAHDHLMLAK